MDKYIKKDIGDTITETNVEKFGVEMIPYEDASIQEIKPADPEA